MTSRTCPKPVRPAVKVARIAGASGRSRLETEPIVGDEKSSICAPAESVRLKGDIVQWEGTFLTFSFLLLIADASLNKRDHLTFCQPQPLEFV